MYVCTYTFKNVQQEISSYCSTAVIFFVSFSNLIFYSMYINLREFVRLDYSPSVI